VYSDFDHTAFRVLEDQYFFDVMGLLKEYNPIIKNQCGCPGGIAVTPWGK